jgi:cysteine-rich repeat protein
MISTIKLLGAAILALGLVTRAESQVTCPLDITLAGNSSDELLVGTNQGDRITGNGGRDTLRGLEGSDCLRSGSFDDKLFGGPGNDQLIAEGGNDLLDGGPGDDELNGGSNQDILIGGPGRDEVIGEGDDDTFVVRAGDVPAGQTEILNGGSGNDLAALNFDPGTVPPRNFTVTDPDTGGKYRFIDVERIEIRICGNGVREEGEACDDGNRVSGDGCDSNCTPTACGNEVVTSGETCDDGNTAGGDGCSATCQKECGNGVREGSEECDDGNQVPGDGCDPNCRVSACGNGVVTPPEACDDGNTRNGDGCSSTCTRECGDGTVGPNEQCDDGNTVSGDGCTASCVRECTTVGVCADDDQCTTDACVGGKCVNTPLTGTEGVLCELDAVLNHAVCPGEALGPKLRLKVGTLRRVVRRLSEATDNDVLLQRATRLLAQTGAVANRLANRGRISATCADDIASWLDDLETVVDALVTP